MAVQSPPYALQNAQHSAQLFRQAVGSQFFRMGVVGSGELNVTAQSTPNMSVRIAAGRCWISGSQVSAPAGFTFTTQAGYFALNDAPVTVTVATADPTNPRIDVVYIAVQDSFYSGATNAVVLGVVTGTPAPSPAVPAAPANSMVLATVAVAANATSIVSGNIASARFSSVPTPQLYTCTSSTHPTAAVWPGFEIYETDTGLVKIWTGTTWATVGPSNNSGTSGVLAGAAPPAGTPLLVKTFYGSVSFNANGDGTVSFPGGPFPNGLLTLQVSHYSPGAAPSNNIEFVPWGATLASTSLRCYFGTSIFGGTGVACTVVAVGW